MSRTVDTRTGSERLTHGCVLVGLAALVVVVPTRTGDPESAARPVAAPPPVTRIGRTVVAGASAQPAPATAGSARPAPAEAASRDTWRIKTGEEATAWIFDRLAVMRPYANFSERRFGTTPSCEIPEEPEACGEGGPVSCWYTECRMRDLTGRAAVWGLFERFQIHAETGDINVQPEFWDDPPRMLTSAAWEERFVEHHPEAGALFPHGVPSARAATRR